MNLDIKTGVQTAFIISLLFGVLFLLLGYRTIQSGVKLRYFRKRRDMLVRGWRLVFFSVILGALSAATYVYAEPVTYRFFPPSPTITPTPTITITPSISPTPSITLTPTITDTPSITNTPSVPDEILRQFETTQQPLNKPIFSGLQFSRELDKDFLPVDPAIEFANPVGKLYGMFSYDQMTVGAQWTAIWYRDGEMVYYETLPWNGGTGGYGYTEWEPNSEDWLPGTYTVQLFIGTQWIEGASGTFTVTGMPPTSTITVSPTITITPTPTFGPSPTPTPSPTFTPTLTPTVTRTPTVTFTYPPTNTRAPTITSTITVTPVPTWTLRPTDTRRPTLTFEPPHK